MTQEISRGTFAGVVVSEAADDVIRSPLWLFPPEAVKAVQHERRRRFSVDVEPIGDPEYT